MGEQNKIESLQREIEYWKQESKTCQNVLEGRWRSWAEDELGEHTLDRITNSPIPLTLKFIRNLSKHTLIILVLNREIYLNDLQREYEKSIKNNDREIFNTQKKEILRLQKILIEESEVYKDYNSLLDRFYVLKKEYKKLEDELYCMKQIWKDSNGEK